VDQQQVDIVGAQTLEGLFHGVVILIERGPQLGLQENLLTGNAGQLDGPAHGLLVLVGVGGVDEAVAVLQGAEDGSLRLRRGKQEGADAGHGHFHAVIQGDISLVAHKIQSPFRVVWMS
jgi:hypothetical protein